ncbi:MAG: hypothetical protein J6J78_05145, partial [Clostridia bacterium]|nr:hypothetical protein [Clostridia bacterium]
ATLSKLRIDRAALTQEHRVLLAAANTPEEYVQLEWFPTDKAPAEVSTLWDAPEAVDDLVLLSDNGEIPALAFTCKNSAADYLVLRRSGDDTEVVAVLNGETGNIIVWADPEPDLNTVYEYSILPRHRLLYESGVLLTGLESRSVTHSPGGFLNRMFGS